MRKPLSRGVPIDSSLREIETRHNQLKVFPTTPDTKQLQEGEIFFIDDGATRYLAIRSGDSIRKVEVS